MEHNQMKHEHQHELQVEHEFDSHKFEVDSEQ
jgi:hypothetical protein